MLSLNLLHLIHNKTIPIKYVWVSFKHNDSGINAVHKNILNLITLLNSLSMLYIYLVNYSVLKQKILMTTTYTQHVNTLKYISFLSTNYYISNHFNSGICTNWILLKKQLLVYKWLEYFFFINLTLKKKQLLFQNTLYILYLKLKLKYNGIKKINLIPKTILLMSNNNNTFLKEIESLKKNIILINTKKINSSFIFCQLITENTNYYTLKFLLNIITTAFLHGMYFNIQH